MLGQHFHALEVFKVYVRTGRNSWRYIRWTPINRQRSSKESLWHSLLATPQHEENTWNIFSVTKPASLSVDSIAKWKGCCEIMSTFWSIRIWSFGTCLHSLQPLRQLSYLCSGAVCLSSPWALLWHSPYDAMDSSRISLPSSSLRVFLQFLTCSRVRKDKYWFSTMALAMRSPTGTSSVASGVKRWERFNHML